jgi:exonuclease VII large subunit
MVAHTSVKTPTAVAEFLISKFIEAEAIVTDLINQLSDTTNQLIDSEKELINNTR